MRSMAEATVCLAFVYINFISHAVAYAIFYRSNFYTLTYIPSNYQLYV